MRKLRCLRGGGEYMDAFQSAFMFVIEFVMMYAAIKLGSRGFYHRRFRAHSRNTLGIFFKI